MYELEVALLVKFQPGFQVYLIGAWRAFRGMSGMGLAFRGGGTWNAAFLVKAGFPACAGARRVRFRGLPPLVWVLVRAVASSSVRCLGSSPGSFRISAKQRPMMALFFYQ